MRKYEQTSNTLKVPLSLSNKELSQIQTQKIIKEKVNLYQEEKEEEESVEWTENKIVILYNFLSKEECDYFKQQSTSLGLKNVDYDPRYRTCQRVSFDCPELASCFFERILPFIPKNYDSWKIDSLNEVFRVVKYVPGGHFSPHYDGVFSRTGTNRSFKTFMVYLNQEFKGGSTNFLVNDPSILGNSGPIFSENKWVSPEDFVLKRIQPKEGMLLIFDHSILHEGSPIFEGEKWIMRSEVMYQYTIEKF